MNKRLYKENIFVAVIFCFIISSIYEGLIFLTGIFVFRGGDYLYALKSVILPEALYNSVIMILFFFPIVKYFKWLEQKGALSRKY
jgi:rod shape-determining protein MreD